MIVKYRVRFSNLNVSTVKGYKAPYKAVMLLAVLELAEYGMLKENRITFSDDLIDACSYIWDRYIGIKTVFLKDFTNPFWYMKSEPFWNLYHKDGSTVSSSERKPSEDILRTGYYGEFEEDLFRLFSDSKCRSVLRVTLISKYIEPIISSNGGDVL